MAGGKEFKYDDLADMNNEGSGSDTKITVAPGEQGEQGRLLLRSGHDGSERVMGNAADTQVETGAHDSTFSLGQEAWKLPDKKEARAKAKLLTFGEGTSSIFSTPVTKFEVISYGLAMYFKLLQYLIAIFAFMSLISVPIIYLCFFGPA